jgi:hypothetical protein
MPGFIDLKLEVSRWRNQGGEDVKCIRVCLTDKRGIEAAQRSVQEYGVVQRVSRLPVGVSEH